MSAEPREPRTVEKRTKTGVFLRRVLQERRAGVLGHRLVHLEVAVRARAARVHDALGNALVVEVGDLLTEVEVFHERRAALASLERIVGVGNAHALIGGQKFIFGPGLVLVQLLFFGQPVGCESRLAGPVGAVAGHAVLLETRPKPLSMA